MKTFLTVICLPFVAAFSTRQLHSPHITLSYSKRVATQTSTAQTSQFQFSLKASQEDFEEKEQQQQQNQRMNVVFTKIGSTTSAVVAGTFYAVLAYRRDALMVSFFMGAISNGILSKVLKKILNQERPADLIESDLDLPPSDNGMPSSHAMSLGFICTFTALQLPVTALPMIAYVAISLLYRINTKLHTTEQIIVGLSLGTMNGYLWRTLCIGTNPFLIDVNIMDWVTQHFLNENGLLPLYALSIPAIVGAAVVGSVERRISRFLENKKNNKTE